ncbi:unnamed protein product [Closterium sp. NIES-53]
MPLLLLWGGVLGGGVSPAAASAASSPPPPLSMPLLLWGGGSRGVVSPAAASAASSSSHPVPPVLSVPEPPVPRVTTVPSRAARTLLFHLCPSLPCSCAPVCPCSSRPRPLPIAPPPPPRYLPVAYASRLRRIPSPPRPLPRRVSSPPIPFPSPSSRIPIASRRLPVPFSVASPSPPVPSLSHPRCIPIASRRLPIPLPVAYASHPYRLSVPFPAAPPATRRPTCYPPPHLLPTAPPITRLPTCYPLPHLLPVAPPATRRPTLYLPPHLLPAAPPQPRPSRYRADHPFHLALRPRAPPRSSLPLLPASSLPVPPDPVSGSRCAVSRIVSHLLSSLVVHPTAPPLSVLALVATISAFNSSHRLDYASHLVSGPASSPSTEDALDLSLEVMEDRQFELGFPAAVLPHLCAMLLAPEGIQTPLTPRPLALTRRWSRDLTPLPPPGRNVVSGRWLYKVNQLPGAPPVFKARYVARGFSQREGVDFFQTFAPNPKMTTLWALLHVAAQRDYELHSLDFSTAFLQGILHEHIWLHRPAWLHWLFPCWDPLAVASTTLGFFLSSADPSLFVRRTSTPFFVLVYVDDLVFVTPDRTALAFVKEELKRRHTYTDLGELQRYLGLKITRDRAACTIMLTQSHMSFESSGPSPKLVGCLIRTRLRRVTASALAPELSRGGQIERRPSLAPAVRQRSTLRPWPPRSFASYLSSSLTLVSGLALPQSCSLTTDLRGTGDTGAGGAGVTTGGGGTGSTTATSPGCARASGAGAAGTSCVGGAGAREPAEPGAAGARGAGVGGPGAGGAGAVGAGDAGAGVVDPGAGGAGGTVRPRSYFVPLLQQVLGVPSSTGLTPPFLCPPLAQSQPLLQLASPLPAPSLYTKQSGGLTQRREPASRPVSFVRPARRIPRSRPPPVPSTHAMALRPSSVPLRIPLPAPPESNLPEAPDPKSDRARAASPTASRLLATAVTDPSFESAAAISLVAELLEFAAACRLDYTTALVAEPAFARGL